MVPESIKMIARKLRNNSTKQEVILWNYLKWKALAYKFLRQSPIYLFTEDSWLDRYIIADFYCKEKKLVIELDWDIHKNKEVYILDREKEKLLKIKWIKVLRIENNEIMYNISNTIEKIKNELT